MTKSYRTLTGPLGKSCVVKFQVDRLSFDQISQRTGNFPRKLNFLWTCSYKITQSWGESCGRIILNSFYGHRSRIQSMKTNPVSCIFLCNSAVIQILLTPSWITVKTATQKHCPIATILLIWDCLCLDWAKASCTFTSRVTEAECTCNNWTCLMSTKHDHDDPGSSRSIYIHSCTGSKISQKTNQLIFSSSFLFS